MKNPKRPTRRQKERMKHLPAPKNWLVERDTPNCFKVVHKVTGEVRELVIKK